MKISGMIDLSEKFNPAKYQSVSFKDFTARKTCSFVRGKITRLKKGQSNKPQIVHCLEKPYRQVG